MPTGVEEVATGAAIGSAAPGAAAAAEAAAVAAIEGAIAGVEAAAAAVETAAAAAATGITAAATGITAAAAGLFALDLAVSVAALEEDAAGPDELEWERQREEELRKKREEAQRMEQQAQQQGNAQSSECQSCGAGGGGGDDDDPKKKKKKAEEEIEDLPEFKNKTPDEIEAELKKRGWDGPYRGDNGGKIYTKTGSDGRVAGVRVDPADPSLPPNYAGARPHVHKETFPSGSLRPGGGYGPQGTTGYNDAGIPTNNPAQKHIPINGTPVW